MIALIALIASRNHGHMPDYMLLASITSISEDKYEIQAVATTA